MFRRAASILSPVMALAMVALPGCISIQAIEPVMEPPATYKGNAIVAVEFAPPATVGFRCAERGAKFFGLPGINSGACADTSLITMIDPCQTLTAGDYAGAICASLNWRSQEAAGGGRAGTPPRTRNFPEAGPQLIRAGYMPGATAQPTEAASGVILSSNPLVEFVAPAALEMRCAERGAKMFTAGAGHSACADRLVVTAINPCDVADSGWYARTLCHELAHVNGWPSDHSHGQGNFRLASQSPQALALASTQSMVEARVAANVGTTDDKVRTEARTAELIQAKQILETLVIRLKLDRLPAVGRSLVKSLGQNFASAQSAATSATSTISVDSLAETGSESAQGVTQDIILTPTGLRR